MLRGGFHWVAEVHDLDLRPVTASRRVPSAETSRLYAGDWAAFVTWCRAASTSALPADVDTIGAYLATLRHLGAGALGRRVAAIAAYHRRAGMAVPDTGDAARSILRAARCAALPRRPAALAPGRLRLMAGRCDGGLAGVRDRALLLLLAETAETGRGLSRKAVTGIVAEHVRFTAKGVLIGEADRAVSQILIARNADPERCAVRALEAWLRRSDTSFGPVFRKIDRWGNLEVRRLGTDAVRRILARRAV